MASEERCCPFCLKTFEKTINSTYSSTGDEDKEKVTKHDNCNWKGRELLQHFFLLLRRHLQQDDISLISQNPVLSLKGESLTVQSALEPCLDCATVIKSFCDIYNEIKILELKLHWRLGTLVNIVRCSRKVKSRMNTFQMKIEQQLKDNTDDQIDVLRFIREIGDFRSEIVKKCALKLRSVHPKVKLKKLRPNRKVYNAFKSDIGQTQPSSKGNPSQSRSSSLKEVSGSTSNAINEPHNIQTFQSGNDTSSLSSSSKPDTEVLVYETVALEEIIETVSDITQSDFEQVASSECEVNFRNANDNDQFTCPDVKVKSPESSTKLFSDFESVLEEHCSTPKLQLVGTSNSNRIKQEEPGLHEANDAEITALDTDSIPGDIIRPLDETPPTHIFADAIEMNDSMASPDETLSNDNEYNPSPEENNGDNNSIIEQNETIKDNLLQPKIESVNISDHEDNNTGLQNSSKSEEMDFMMTTYPCTYKRKHSSCLSKFYNPDDLQNHSKLHGKFKCSFCPFKSSYAPSIPKHELTHKRFHSSHGPHAKSVAKKSFLCPHCNFKTKFKNTFIRHHLKLHMNLISNQNTCPICKFKWVQKAYTGAYDLASEHYKNYHKILPENPKQIFRCTYEGCPAYFLKSHQLKLHNLHHYPERSNFKCVDCDKHFGGRKRWLRHLELNHSYPLVCCTVPGCEKKFASEETMLNHRKACLLQSKVENAVSNKSKLQSLDHEGPLPYPCKEPNCSEQFFTPEELERHLKFHGIFKCMFCEEVKTYAPDLSIHELEHHPQPPKRSVYSGLCRWISCVQCNAKLYGFPNYVNHHLSHLNLPEVMETSCLICKHKFNMENKTIKIAIRNHYKSSHDVEGGEAFSCEVEGCSAYFRLPGQLTNHMKIAHLDAKKSTNRKNGKPYYCSDCDSAYEKPHQLEKHRLKKHLSKFIFKCEKDDCSKMFETEMALKNHLKSHDQNLGFSCQICKKYYDCKGYRNIHMKSHDKNTPKLPARKKKKISQSVVLCTICGKEFKDKSQLDQHMLSHSGPESWEFACDTCGKKCMTLQKLEEHQNTHRKKDKIVFTCEHCGLTYAHRHNFRHHLKNKHGVILEDPRKKRCTTNVK